MIVFTARRLRSLAAFFAFVGMPAWFLSCSRPAKRSAPAEHPAEVAEVRGPGFTVRISSFPDHGGFVAGAYYRFESLPRDSKNWVTAMEFRHDDPVPVPKQNIRFVTSKSAFVFMGWKYAVTTDGGKNWRVWNAEKDLAGWQCCNYGLIQEVELSQSGNGKMILRPIPARPGEVPELVTSDFGVHWVRPQVHD